MPAFLVSNLYKLIMYLTLYKCIITLFFVCINYLEHGLYLKTLWNYLVIFAFLFV